MKFKENISFIICCKHFKDSLFTVLKSIKDQYESGDELILVINNIDHSGFSEEFISKFDQCLYNPKVGIAISRNIGVQKANHEYLAFVDDDTILPKDWRKNCLSSISKSSVAITQGETFAIKNSMIVDMLSLNRYFMFDIAGSIIRKTAILDIGLFDETFIRSEDMDLGTRIVYKGWDIALNSNQIIDIDKIHFFEKLKNKLVSSPFEAQIIYKSGMSLPFKFPLLFLKMIFNPFKWEILLKYFYLNKIEKINILQRYSIHKRLRLFMMKVSGEVYSLNFNCRILFNKNNLILLNLSQERSFHILNNKDFSFENNVLVLSDDYFKKQKIFRFFRKVKI